MSTALLRISAADGIGDTKALLYASLTATLGVVVMLPATVEMSIFPFLDDSIVSSLLNCLKVYNVLVIYY